MEAEGGARWLGKKVSAKSRGHLNKYDRQLLVFLELMIAMNFLDYYAKIWCRVV